MSRPFSTDNPGDTCAENAPSFQFFALSPRGTWDPGVPIAGSRAGAVGLLDLCYLCDTGHARAAVGRLANLARGRFGLVLHRRLSDVELAALGVLESCDTILLSPEDGASLEEVAGRCRRVASRIGLICTSERDARHAEEAGLDFVVAKGNEAGGRVGGETCFILLQRLLSRGRLPVVAWGGVGFHTAAACRVAGAAGVCLDWQLALCRESGLPRRLQRRIAAMDGTETAVVSPREGEFFRFYSRQGMKTAETLQSLADRLRGESGAGFDAWRQAVGQLMGADDPDDRLFAVGQDAALASEWHAAAPTVARALSILRERVDAYARDAASARTLAFGSPLARSHGTEYPIVQGPMTRVSDVPEFCDAVARAGGLPFLALALMRKADVKSLLERTRTLLGERPWGVGILGFVDASLRAEQLEAIREFRPPYAIIAGGRPDQAAALERDGIHAYLHVPSPELLRMFISEGARRFVFEGSECGGHVGPRTSFVLWDTMIRVLLDADLGDEEASRVHALFAGGIHDALSGSMVAAAAQGLVERGMKVGVVIGSAYLFTEELVRTGAATESFQSVALETDRTTVLETGPGHAIRCAPTDYAREFGTKKRELMSGARPTGEVSGELERMHVGRLRIASKGLTRTDEPAGADTRFKTVSETEQRKSGMYMMGQLSALHTSVRPMRELHEDVCGGATTRLAESVPRTLRVIEDRETAPAPLDVAIIGMSCLLPGAVNVCEYWHNILEKRDAVGEIPADYFDYTRWFDPDRNARDKIYSKWGGFLGDVPFDPLKYGIPPSALKSIEPMQLLALEVVDQALRDAGYAEKNPHRARTSTILGVGGGLSELGSNYTFRALIPQYIENPQESLWSRLPEWTEDSFPGILLNVVAGRVANRFDFGGVNYVVDAACASSLAAVYQACRELVGGTSDMVITGGCDTVQNPLGYVCFSKTGALSPRGRSRPFDAGADGIAISEGLAVVVLKRREDAERDGDRIYAVIRGVAGSSDGRSKGLTAPHREGQVRALERAYSQAGFSPATVGLIEAHGTGTEVGDQTECEALSSLLARYDSLPRSVALGGVKSMIGHTKCAAGVAGLIKATLALYHRVLPPTLHVETPNAKAGLGNGALYVNSELRPWIRGSNARRAGVSAFGFGGSNFHAVLEEYADEARPRVLDASRDQRSAELIVLSADSESKLAAKARKLAELLAKLDRTRKDLRLADVALSLHRGQPSTPGAHRAAMVAKDIAELCAQLEAVAGRFFGAAGESGAAPKLPPGVYCSAKDSLPDGRTAFLFPGQGAQFPNMLRDLAVEFSEVRGCFEEADAVLRHTFDRPLSRFVFPAPAFTDEERAAAFDELKATNIAQPALGACDLAMLRLLGSFGVKPSMVAGHSYGELVALHAAGCFDERALFDLSRARGEAMVAIARERADADLGGMLAVGADGDAVRKVIADCGSVWLANLNSPRQTIISGSRDGLTEARKRLDDAGLSSTPVPVACAFHSPIMNPARDRFAGVLSNLEFRPPDIDVFSNVTAAAYAKDAGSIRRLLSEQLISHVRFTKQIEAMYAAGARVFVEAGPNAILSKLAGQILGKRPYLAVATQTRRGDGLTDLLRALGALIAGGVKVDLERLYDGRTLSEVNLTEYAAEAEPEYGPHIWLVNGAYARPASESPRTFPERAVMQERTPGPVPAGPDPRPADAPNPRIAAEPGHERVEEAGKMQVTRTSPPVADTSAPPDADAFAQFQETMRLFLETQRAAMEAYLGSGDVQLDPAEGVPEARASAAFETEFAAPQREVEPAAPGSAGDPGIAPATADVVEEGVAPAPEKGKEAAVSLEERLTAIVSDRTGYPPEMLDLDANLEADLGIDSIKRVEIIGTFRRSVVPALKEPPAWFMERMSEVTTLRECLDGVRELMSREGLVGDAGEPAADTISTGTAEALDLDERVKEIVAERTGYPMEMLDLDANMEADLGIDSIKRVEIIGTFRRSIFPSMTEPPAWFMERMAGVATMREICEGVAELITRQNGDASTPGAAYQTLDDAIPTGQTAEAEASVSTENRIDGLSPDQSEDCPRCVARVIPCPLPEGGAASPPAGAILLTDDGHGVADELAEAIEAGGGHTVILRESRPASRAEAEALASDIRKRHGKIGAVVHLRPLRDAPRFPGVSQAEWNAHIDEEIKSLLFMLQAIDPELRSSTDGGVAVLAVTRGGGDFEPQATQETSHPWRGGIAGLLKTAAREWPGARFRAVDADELPGASRLMQELAAGGPVEIGYRGGQRLTVVASYDELPASRPQHGGPLDESSVVLVTGGARGITAQIVHEVALRAKPTLILLGRSPMPEGDEDDLTAGVEDPIALRKVIIAAMQRGGDSVTPKAVEAELSRVLRQREIRRTMEAARETGARIEYHRCDVRDADALKEVVGEVRRRHGGIDALIHGAGVIEDRYILDKEADSFDRVVGTKVDPLLTLSEILDPDHLRVVMLFSSVAGFHGNPGQGDYAVANEILNRMACRLSCKWKAKIVAMNWGPWHGAGMVTEEVARQFEERGVGMVTVPAGRRAAWREIIHADGTDTVVIIGPGPWVDAAESIPDRDSAGMAQSRRD